MAVFDTGDETDYIGEMVDGLDGGAVGGAVYGWDRQGAGACAGCNVADAAGIWNAFFLYRNAR